jgi:SAM-dependent methyltransferase
MDSSAWDARYAASDLVWSAGPNVWVEQIARDLAPGRAIDLAGGEGRNGLWLAERGWSATVVDFSPVAIERAQRLAQDRLGDHVDRFTGTVGDLLDQRTEAGAFDLVLLVYLQVGADERRSIMRAGAELVAAGGMLLVVGHHADNIAQGVGGPQDPTILYTEAELVADLQGTGVVVERSERVARHVETVTGGRSAIDALLVARRPLVG